MSFLSLTPPYLSTGWKFGWEDLSFVVAND